eukprot:CAMPEP_0170779902 /NCGR_PEP_ID=MMETSP0733-20121128/13249_1 /TAXON_ID=186038 /ORGANISM="Fragilariopsis kerguelensis, Strain L26-C5" /LENGTH=148 /DNA_ID=CAMNT_0011123577 /DNA_START=102 /DNA_END=548 /DNA_ORIENTATION=+
MMFLSRITILTAVLLATTAVVETQAQAPGDPCTDVTGSCAGVNTTCTYNGFCLAGNCQYKCNALGFGAAPGSTRWEEQQAQEGSYNAGIIIDPSKANNETDVDEVDVVAVPKDAMEGTEDESTSGGSPAGVASYVLLAVGGAAIIAGL